MAHSQASLTAQDAAQGRVLWLPPYETVEQAAMRAGIAKSGGFLNRSKAIPPNAWGHPIIVVSRPASDPDVVFFYTITSLRGRLVGDTYRGDSKKAHRAAYWPIYPTPDHPDACAGRSFPTMQFAERTITLSKNSYVKIDELYSLEWTLLERFRKDCRVVFEDSFDSQSISKLMSQASTLTDFALAPQASVTLARALVNWRQGRQACRAHNATTWWRGAEAVVRVDSAG